MADIFLSDGKLLVLLIFFIFTYIFIYRKSFFHYIDKFYIELVFFSHEGGLFSLTSFLF